MPWSRGRVVGALGALAVVAAGTTTGCRPAERAQGYESHPVDRRDLAETVAANGRVRAKHEVVVPIPVGQRLAEVLVRSGQRVETGAPLGRLESTLITLRMQEARARLRAGEANVTAAEARALACTERLDRVERLQEAGQVSAVTVEETRLECARAQAELETFAAERELARAQWRIAEAEGRSVNIVSPLDGLILSTPDPADGNPAPAFRLTAGLDQVEVDAQVAEADIAAVRLGARAELLVQAYPARVFAADVVAVGSLATGPFGSATFPVTLQAGNSDEALLPGMSAVVRLVTRNAPDALVVREAALRFTPPDIASTADPPRSRVYRMATDGTLEPISVRPLAVDGAFAAVEVVGDHTLAPGDRVVTGMSGGSDRSRPNVRLGGR